MRKLLIIPLFIIVILLIGVVNAEILQTKNSAGRVTNEFYTSDEVYLRSTVALCSCIPESVDVYIVNSGEVVLSDVRGQQQEVELTKNCQIPSNTKIWTDLEVGDYDIIVDCDKSGSYNPNTEPKTTFSVSFKEGSASAKIGDKNPKNSSWQYDPENPNLINEILQLSLLAEGENLKLENITIKAIGSGNDTKISKVKVYSDENNNGKLDDGEIMIGESQAYDEDDGEKTILLEAVLIEDVPENILIVYEMDENVSEGEFSLSVESIYGIGENSDKVIRFSGLPIESNFLTVLPKKTCLGNLILDLTPNPAFEDSIIIAKVSNLTGCENKTVVLKRNPCSFVTGDIASCVLTDNFCEMNFTALESRRYYACIDKNGDGDMTDALEGAFNDLVIEEIPEEVNITENITEFENITEVAEENVSVTGKAVKNTELLEGQNILILLEITLLLILFLLVVIAVRLRRPKEPQEDIESEE